MKALIYHGPGDKRWEDKADATIQQPTDAIVKRTDGSACLGDARLTVPVPSALH